VNVAFVITGALVGERVRAVVHVHSARLTLCFASPQFVSGAFDSAWKSSNKGVRARALRCSCSLRHGGCGWLAHFRASARCRTHALLPRSLSLQKLFDDLVADGIAKQ